VLPLDLHVLSLSLAFILSQDQTLPCISFVFVLSLQGRLFFLDGSIFTQNLLFLYYLYLTIPKSDSCAFPPGKKSAPQRYLFRIPHLASPTLGLLYLWKAGAKVGAFSFTCKFCCKKNLNNFCTFRQTPDLAAVNQEKKFQEKIAYSAFFCGNWD
jgi:hypothetical protein